MIQGPLWITYGSLQACCNNDSGSNGTPTHLPKHNPTCSSTNAPAQAQSHLPKHHPTCPSTTPRVQAPPSCPSTITWCNVMMKIVALPVFTGVMYLCA